METPAKVKPLSRKRGLRRFISPTIIHPVPEHCIDDDDGPTGRKIPAGKWKWKTPDTLLPVVFCCMCGRDLYSYRNYRKVDPQTAEKLNVISGTAIDFSAQRICGSCKCRVVQHEIQLEIKESVVKTANLHSINLFELNSGTTQLEQKAKQQQRHSEGQGSGQGEKSGKILVTKPSLSHVSGNSSPSSPCSITLHDEHTFDVWTQQRNHFFEQQQEEQHDSEFPRNRDDVFVFHLLAIHAKYCIKPSCKNLSRNSKPTMGGINLQVSTPSLKMAVHPTKSSTSDLGDDNPSLSSTVCKAVAVQKENVPVIPSTSTVLTPEESSGGWILEETGVKTESPDTSHDLTADSLPTSIKSMKTHNAMEESSMHAQEGTDGWIREQPHVTPESPDIAHDHTADSIGRVIRLDTDDDAVDEDESDGWILEQPDSHEPPNISCDISAASLTEPIKLEIDDSANEGNLDHALDEEHTETSGISERTAQGSEKTLNDVRTLSK